MLDVHPPHKPLHGAGEFFLHLFTITIGLLIAVGIEGAVTRWEHHKLANEARESLTVEIKKNAASAKHALQQMEEQQKKLQLNEAQVAAILKNPNGPEAKNTNIDASYGFVNFEKTAWRTAQATGALSYMPYDQAEKFSSIYEMIDAVEKAESASTEDEAQFLGIVRRDPDIDGRMSKETAATMAQRFGIWEGHLLTMHIRARVLVEEQDAFLEGREPNGHMSDSIHN